MQGSCKAMLLMCLAVASALQPVPGLCPGRIQGRAAPRLSFRNDDPLISGRGARRNVLMTTSGGDVDSTQAVRKPLELWLEQVRKDLMSDDPKSEQELVVAVVRPRPARSTFSPCSA